MNRLQKKCFIASAGFHLLLVLIVLIGPAFLSSQPRSDDILLITFIPLKTTDLNVSGGGSPKAPPPAPAVQPPQPAVQPAAPPAVKQPEVVAKETPLPKEPAKEIKKSEDSFDPADHKRKIEVSTTLVKRKPSLSDESRARAAADAKAVADARREAAAAIGQAVNGIRNQLSGSTTIELQGPGGGGVPYANFLSAVKSVYDRAWILPAGVATDSARATASVTIARDGTVISARIVRRSGIAAVDESVQDALEKVKYAAPLPDDAKEDQRTIQIVFDVAAKLLG
jgi:TonB family protein